MRRSRVRHIAEACSHPRTGRPTIGLAQSRNGFEFTVDRAPFLTPAGDGPRAAYEEFSVKDPRVRRFDDEYLITYSACSRNGMRVAPARTRDSVSVERVSLITQGDYRNVVISPGTFEGPNARIDRPHLKIAPWSIRVSYSWTCASGESRNW